MAQTILSVLKDYAEDTSYQYDTDLYHDWKSKIELAIADYERNGEGATESLRSIIITANEHVIDYEWNWAEGSVVMRSLLTVVAVGGGAELYLGLIPLICNCGSFNIMNWIILGSAGALMAVLLNLRNSDYTEVGNTAGRKEMWRTVSGGALGLMAGALIYCAIVTGILPAAVAPHPNSPDLKDMAGAVIWAMFSGFALDSVVEKVFSPLKSTSS